MRVDFHGMKFDLPEDWVDVTADLPDGSPPSIARPTGAGTIQFSLAKYVAGDLPNVEIHHLREFIEDFIKKNNLNDEGLKENFGKIISISSISINNLEYIFYGYFSNGRDIILITYVCLDRSNSEIRNDIDGLNLILRSLDF